MSLLRAALAPVPARTHPCAALAPPLVGAHVVLAGALLPERSVPTPPPHAVLTPRRKVSGALSFFPLRDPSGTAQLVVRSPHIRARLADVPVESAVLIQGRVAARPPKDRRPVSPSRLFLPSLTPRRPPPATSRCTSTPSPSSTPPIASCPFTPPTTTP